MLGFSLASKVRAITGRTDIAMNFVLSPDEGRLLLRHLTQWIEHLDADLVHTDKRELQRSLARELDSVRALTDRLRSAVEQSEPTAKAGR